MITTTTQPNEEPHSPAPCAEAGTGLTPLQAARSADSMKKETRMSDQWETFCDVGYYHMWRLRRITERGWNDGFHINTKAEAEGLCELPNKLEGEIERERALANEAIATWKKTREERDAALIRYNECRATIEDARRALGATAHEGPLLAAMRVTEQRDMLAGAIKRYIAEDYTLVALQRTLAAVEGGSDEISNS